LLSNPQDGELGDVTSLAAARRPAEKIDDIPQEQA
jgi:hypothetical protein